MKVVLLIFALTLKFEYLNSMWPLTLTSSKDMDIDRGTTQSIKSRSNKSGRIQKRHKKNRSSIVFPSGASKARVSKRKWYGYYKEWNPRIIITFVSWSWVYFSFSFWLFMIPKKAFISQRTTLVSFFRLIMLPLHLGNVVRWMDGGIRKAYWNL